MTSLRLCWTWLVWAWSAYVIIAGRPMTDDRHLEKVGVTWSKPSLRGIPSQYISFISDAIDPAAGTPGDEASVRDTINDDDDDADISDDSRPRCGVEDFRHGLLFSRRPQQYVIGPSKWNKTRLTFRILNFPANLSYEDTRFALRNAFQVWSDVTPLEFDEVHSGSSDISVEFATGKHLDGYPFDGPGKVVAHAFFPGEERGGDVHFDADEPWTFHSHEGVNLFMVAAHEIGHALGLSHSKEPGALMSPWHHGYYADFVMPDDDVLAIQQLYGVRVPSRRRLYKAPTAPSVPPPTPPLHPDNGLDTDRADALPDPCWTDLDAISLIRGEVFAFKGKWFWRLSVDAKDRLLMPNGVTPTRLNRFWFGLPTDLERVDAVFEHPHDGHIFFFSGNRYWEFQGNTVDTEMSTTDGRPLFHLGLPNHVVHLDTAFIWGYNQRVYLVSGIHYWKLDDTGNSVVVYSYPRYMASSWAGVPLPIDAAFTHSDGRTYFFKGTEYWEFNNVRMHVRHSYPRHLGQQWLGCRQRLLTTPKMNHVSTSSASLLCPLNSCISNLNLFYIVVCSNTLLRSFLTSILHI